ncbi:hypothetical protein D915_002129 [Fasciola hepatica]|uniref:Uncharacterized protein n=1 Tax=Fasciola hepatica TaxID=6192 RepID=A0A2H1CPU6_FASHE|nr:hypothetical protein D915_002129 [Fasciola hepatica]
MQIPFLLGLLLPTFVAIKQVACHVDQGYEKVDWMVKNTTNFMTLSSRLLKKPLILVPFTEIPLYQYVQYITNETEKNDPKVRDVHIKHFYFYTHIYLASLFNADKKLSLVALQDEQILGANMVLPVDQIKSMYAPTQIRHVLDFVRKCYAAGRPQISRNPGTQALVSTLRPASSVEVNKAIIEETTNLIQMSTSVGSYHLLWENSNGMNDFLQPLGYEILFCGKNTTNNPCNWIQMGVLSSVAETLCLYRWTNRGVVHE